jgi:CMP-N,N'-diacetyllegionaminic acid synthase
MKIIGVIPARKNSRRLPNKNFRELAGKPLIDWTVEAAIKSNIFSEIVISTDSEVDHRRLMNYPVRNIGTRPLRLAKDSTPSLDVIRHAVEKVELITKYKFEVIVTLQPTSPLRTADDIRASIQLFCSSKHADSLVSVTELSHIYHPEKIIRKLPKYINFEARVTYPKQDKLYITNGAAIYITSRKILHRSLLGTKCLTFLMPKWKSVDIDTLEDFKMADVILRNKNTFDEI